jgi:hypothetical protein
MRKRRTGGDTSGVLSTAGRGPGSAERKRCAGEREGPARPVRQRWLPKRERRSRRSGAKSETRALRLR